jgi:hypothetical protein
MKIWKQNQSQRNLAAKSIGAIAEGSDSDASSIATSTFDSDGVSQASSSGDEFSDDIPFDDEVEESARSPKASRVGSQSGPSSKSGSGTGTYPVPNLGPDVHEPSSLPALGSNEKELTSSTVNAPLGVVANLVYGKDTSWYRRFVIENQKNRDLGNLTSLADSDQHTRKYEYIKPLSGPVGPKQTKCICTESADNWDMEHSVVVVTSTVTPDVPSGSSFVTKTRVGMCWAENNATKVVISYWIEWSGKSWIKGAIEKGAADGQMVFAKALIAEIEGSIRGGTVRARKPQAPKAPKQRKSSKVSKVKKPVVEEKQQSIVGLVLAMAVSQPIPMVPLPLWSLVLLLLGILAVGKSFRSSSSPSEYDKLRLMQIDEEYQMWKWIDDRTRHGEDFDRLSGSRRQLDTRSKDVFKGYTHQDVK